MICAGSIGPTSGISQISTRCPRAVGYGSAHFRYRRGLSLQVDSGKNSIDADQYLKILIEGGHITSISN